MIRASEGLSCSTGGISASTVGRLRMPLPAGLCGLLGAFRAFVGTQGQLSRVAARGLDRAVLGVGFEEGDQRVIQLRAALARFGFRAAYQSIWKAANHV